MDNPYYNQMLATAHGESRGQPEDFKINVASSLVDRLENFQKYWGFRGTYDNMLQEEYYAVRDAKSGKNNGYAEAMEYLQKKKPFPSKADEEDFKKTVQIMGGVIKGTIPRTKAQFYFNSKEEKSARKSMDFKLLEQVGSTKSKNGTEYKTYRYK